MNPNGMSPNVEMEMIQVPKGQARLVITMVGPAVSVQGPIENKALCYGMLETARDAIQEHGLRVAAEAASRIIRPLIRP